MKITILGSGTSHGVPVVGCDCHVCRSKNSKDKRLRCSALITFGDENYLIDVGPDFRQQALKNKITKLDGVFLTHSHADHVHGIDDLRIFSHKNSRAMNELAKPNGKFSETEGCGLSIYTSSRTENYIRDCFKYIFVDHDKGGGVPKLNFVTTDCYSVENPLKLGGLEVVPVPLLHGNRHTTGWIFSSAEKDGKKHSIAYLTDCSFISETSLDAVRSFTKNGILDVLVIDALRKKPHSSHNNFQQALVYADAIGAKKTLFTHMTHDLLHRDIQRYVNSELRQSGKYENLKEITSHGGFVRPAYDGLSLNV